MQHALKDIPQSIGNILEDRNSRRYPSRHYRTLVLVHSNILIYQSLAFVNDKHTSHHLYFYLFQDSRLAFWPTTSSPTTSGAMSTLEPSSRSECSLIILWSLVAPECGNRTQRSIWKLVEGSGCSHKRWVTCEMLVYLTAFYDIDF